MQFARERTGKLIDAVVAIRGRGYKCPKCGADCHVRAGDKREPHFAHDSGKASEDCENYHPGGEYVPGLAVQSRERQMPYRTLSLYVSAGSLGEAQPTWQLSMLIPEATDETGTVTVPEYRGTLTIPMITLTHGGRRVQVRPQHQPYQVEVCDTDDATYAARVEKPVPGLHRGGCTVFRYSLLGGRRLLEDRPLYWGRGYFLIWAASFGPDWWPMRVYHKPLRPDGTWQCCVIELPVDEDEQTEAWVQRILHRDVRQAPVIMTLVAPVESEWLEDESPIVPAGQEVIIGLFGEPGAFNPSLLEVEFSGGATQHVRLSGSLPLLVSLGGLSAGRTEVWLPEEPDSELSIVAVDQMEVPEPEALMLLFDGARSGRREVPLYDEQAAEALQQVRNGRLSFVGLSLPQQVSGALRFRTAEEIEWHEILLMRATDGPDEDDWEPPAAFAQRVADEIRGRLAHSHSALQLDFGNFGAVTVDLKTEPQHIENTETLSPALRRRIRWMLTLPPLTGRAASGEGMLQLRRALSHDDTRFAAEDRYLLARLVQAKRWPPQAEPYLRMLAKAILDN